MHAEYYAPMRVKRKMKMQKLNTYLVILILSLISTSLTSCLFNDDDNTTYYSDASISAFSLGTLNKYTKTKSSNTGNDTIVKSTYAGSAYKFTIDQAKHEIYNVDSLPAGTDSLHVLCNITALNGGYVNLKSAISDSLFSYISTDSITFEKNPRTIAVTSNDGNYRTYYTIKLNIHKENSQTMTWGSTYKVDAFANVDRLQTTEWNGNMVVKTVKDGNVTLYTSLLGDGKQWTALTPDTKLSTTACISALGSMLYTTDSTGMACKSVDGIHWETITSDGSNLFGDVFGVSNGKLYLLQQLEGADNAASLISYNISTAAVTAESIYGSDYCPLIAEKYTSLCEVKKNNKLIGTAITGFTTAGAAVLYKGENTAEQQKWMFVNNESDQNIPDNITGAAAYGDYLLTLSDGNLYSSLDCGRSWQQRWYIYAPSAVESNAHIASDSKNTLWIFNPNGYVFRGKYNEISWSNK